MIKKIINTVVLICVTISSLQALPDFSSYKNTDEKKQAFFDYLTPYINKINADIYQDRQYILDMLPKIKNEQSIGDKERSNLQSILIKYDAKEQDISPESLSNLLKKVDVIPVSLVLAQAANESAWGTSKFATQANNLFGQWCYKQGCGMVPAQRASGMKHEVRKFSSTRDSIKTYIMNINCHSAYAKLRDIRANLRAKNIPLSGKVLASGLDKYSERGLAYTKDIIAMINQKKLEKFNTNFT